ncbi:hypothetical protein BGW42_000002 [Actinomortierella wolfii]|nr:hypothetical protein BGW42_000002 [Actinomortierella wolfii]
MGGTFKLIFVLVECAGRVNPSDLYTIGKVMSSIDFSVDVGVIVNKVPDEDVEDYERGSIREEIIQTLNRNFSSGFSAVQGLTEECTYCEVTIEGETLRLIDAPGLLEAIDEKIIRNANEITKAFGFEGSYKLIFVVTDLAGRVHPSDLYTMGSVMKAIEFSIDVRLIINKVPDDEIDEYNKPDIKKAILDQCNSVTNGKILSFSVIPRFKKDNPNGPRSSMIEVLKAMRPQKIRNVNQVKGSVRELHGFYKFLFSVRTYVSGLWARFQKWFENQKEPKLLIAEE